MRKIYIRLTCEEAEVLTKIAEDERRHPGDQAAAMLAPLLNQITITTPQKQEALMT